MHEHFVFVDLVVTHYPQFYVTANIFVQFIVHVCLDNDFFYQRTCKIPKIHEKLFHPYKDYYTT